MELTKQELAVLNQLLYADGSALIESDRVKENGEPDEVWSEETVGERDGGIPLAALLAGVEVTGTGSELDDGYTRADEWQRALDEVQDNERICELTVADVYHDTTDGSLAVTFIAGENTYIVFRGTGSCEWPDNLAGVYETDTQDQIEAAAYVSYISERYGGTITVSGHSKGANKAMYATIQLDGLVDRCVAFDGQGFGPNFLDLYAEEIARNRDRIMAINAQDDYVSALLSSVAGMTYYVPAKRLGLNPLRNHAMAVLFGDDMTLSLEEDVERGVFGELISSLVDHLLENVSEEDMMVAATYLGYLTDALLGDKRTDIIAIMSEAEAYAPGGTAILISALVTWPLVNEALAHLASYGGTWALFAYVVGSLCAQHVLQGEDNPHPAYFVSSNTVRDFSEEREAEIADIAQQVSDEPFWDVRKWDAWYRLEGLFGGLNVEAYRSDMETYWRKVIDVAGTTVDQVHDMFERARTRDSQAGAAFRACTDELDAVASKLNAVFPS